MPLPGPTESFFNVVAERFLCQKTFPTTFDLIELWVNSVTGQDTGPGRGTQDAPFLTITQAQKSYSNVSRQEALLVHLEGAAPHVLPEGYVFESSINPDNVSLDPLAANGFQTRAPLTLQAEPIELLVVQPGDITGQVIDPESSLVTVQTSLVFVPGALVGRWIVDGNGILSAIADNTAADLIVAFSGAMLAPLRIMERTAAIVSSNPLSFTDPTIQIRGTLSPVILQGVSIQATNAGAVCVAAGGQVQLVACDVPNLKIGISPNSIIPLDGAIECQACSGLGSLSMLRGVLVLGNCAFSGGTISDMTPNAFVAAFQSIFTAFTNPLFFANNRGPGLMLLQACEVLNAVGDGVHFSGRGVFQPVALKVAGSGSGVHIRLSSTVQGDAVRVITFADSPYTAQLTDRVILCDTTAGAILVNLPDPRNAAGIRLDVKVILGAAGAIVSAGVFSIDGAPIYPLPLVNDGVTVLAGAPLIVGAEWNVL
jgi:hypothetical protein